VLTQQIDLVFLSQNS